MGNDASRFMKSVDITSKTIVVTGANAGIGYITSKELYKYGAHVILACRSKEKGEEAIKKIQQEVSDIKEKEKSEINGYGKGKLDFMQLDLCSLKSVREFSSKYHERGLPLHILINNAGVMNVPQYSTSEDKFETTLAANHLGHFLLTILLLDVLKQSAPSRIVNLSSFVAKEGHINFEDLNTEKPYDKWKAYTQSKLMNIMFTYELARRVEKIGINVNAVNPGFVKTDLLKTSGGGVLFASHLVAKSPEKGAETSLFVAVSPSLDKVTGKYFSDCKEHETSHESYNIEYQLRLWDNSVAMVQLKEDEMIPEIKK